MVWLLLLCSLLAGYQCGYHHLVVWSLANDGFGGQDPCFQSHSVKRAWTVSHPACQHVKRGHGTPSVRYFKRIATPFSNHVCAFHACSHQQLQYFHFICFRSVIEGFCSFPWRPGGQRWRKWRWDELSETPGVMTRKISLQLPLQSQATTVDAVWTTALLICGAYSCAQTCSQSECTHCHR